MKSLKLIAVLIITVSAVFVVHSCKKNIEKSNQNSENFKTQTILPKTISVSCTGEGCTSGGDCKATFGGDWDTFTCCEGCHLEIIFTIGGEVEPIDDKTLSKVSELDMYFETADNYIIENYSEYYDILRIEIGFNDSNHYIVYYFSTVNEDDGSVLVYTAPSGDKMTIDCTGTCTDPNKSCVEKAHINTDGTIDVECGCEGSGCKMVID